MGSTMRSVRFAMSAALVAVEVGFVTPSATAVSSVSAPPVHHRHGVGPAVTSDGCEFHVTGDVKFDTDVACTIFVDAENVVVNLNHHTASGGIYGGLALTLRNGTISNALYTGARATVEHVLATGISPDNAGLPAMQVGSDSVVRDNRFTGNGVGIDLFYEGDRTAILHNTFDGNGTAVWNNRSADVVVAHNTFLRNSFGVAMTDEDENSGEVFHNTITANVFRNNLVGVWTEPFVGVRNLTVEHNQFRDNSGAGVDVEIFCRPACGGAGMRVFANTFTHNGYDPTLYPNSGFSATSEHFGKPTTKGVRHVTVADNTAVANAGLGIDAVGAVDGGGNVARRNVNPAQCAGVVCTPVPPPTP